MTAWSICTCSSGRSRQVRLAAHTLQVTSGILAFLPADDFARVKASDP